MFATLLLLLAQFQILGPGEAFGVNDRGQVVGISDGHAVLWENGRTIVLSMKDSAALAISKSGLIVGRKRNEAGEFHATLWRPHAVDLDPDGSAGQSWAFGVNDAGVVVGGTGPTESGFGGYTIAWAWRRHRRQRYLGTLGGLGSAATDVNCWGIVVCGAADKNQVVHAAWTAGRRLHKLPGFDPLATSMAMAISDNGVIVGFAFTERDAIRGRRHAVVWRRGRLIEDLGTLGGQESVALAVNEAGWIVGWAELLDGEQRAALWRPGQPPVDLSLLAPGALLRTARGVNRAGLIVGRAREGAFVLRLQLDHKT